MDARNIIIISKWTFDVCCIFLYVMLTYYILNSNRSKKIKISFSILFLVTLVIVLVSRMVLGVHYFTDVLAGFNYGVMCSGIAIIIDEKN
ncbi:MAG: phosphatase PAP2 family protein [Clostridium sp.]|nr:MAG: phosphatase PAP2 family protein [Clostridium sp.]